MKNKIAQIYFYIITIDRRYIQLAYFAFMLASYFFIQSPSDGGGDTR